MDYKQLLFFDTMITPKIITVVYWLMLAGAVIAGFMFISNVSFWMGLLYMAGGAVFARIFCELLIVAFKINEALQEIRQK